MKCALCERAVAALTTHHLVPRARLKKGDAMPTIEICPACHRQLHVLFSLEQLAQQYNTLERLRDEPRMERFLKWVRRQDPNKRVRVRR